MANGVGGALFLRLRLEKGLTIAELAKLSGLSDLTIIRCQQGLITPASARVFASIFGCTPEDFQPTDGRKTWRAERKKILAHITRLQKRADNGNGKAK